MPIDFNRLHRQSAEVFHAVGRSVELVRADMKSLIGRANDNDRKRARFCVNLTPAEPVHQMFIAHGKDIYIRPHKHLNKTESILVLDGEVDYVAFSDEGKIADVKTMGPYESGHPFFQTIESDMYHTIIIRSPWLIFVEVTKGPFVKKDTQFANWSPLESEPVKGLYFLENQLINWSQPAG